MMGRSLWFVAGAGAGVYAMTRVRKVAEALSPDGLQDRVGALFLGARLFGAEVATGKAEKETELRERLSLVPHGRPELESPAHGEDRPNGETT